MPISINKFINLTGLSLSENDLTKIPSGVYKLYNLNQLMLDDNKIESIDDDIINLKKLSIIDLQKNKLKYISHNIFKIDSSPILYLSNNKELKRLPYSMIEMKGNYIDLRNTSINNDDKLCLLYSTIDDWDNKGLTKYLLDEKIRSDNIKDNINIFINSFDLNHHLWFNIYCIKMIMKKYYYIEMNNI